MKQETKEQWLWRPMCGGIKEAVKGMKSFDSKEDMMDFVYKHYNEHIHRYDEGELTIEPYGNTPDRRIHWNKSYIICDKNGYAVGGYCTNDFDKNWQVGKLDM